jgi:hypothetical protein
VESVTNRKGDIHKKYTLFGKVFSPSFGVYAKNSDVSLHMYWNGTLR